MPGKAPGFFALGPKAYVRNVKHRVLDMKLSIEKIDGRNEAAER